MRIVKSEVIECSEKEIKAIDLVAAMCIGIVDESSNPETRKIANEIMNNLCDLWKCVEAE